MEVNNFIYNASIKRQIFLLRHRAGLVHRVKDALEIIDGEFNDKISLSLSRLSGKDVSRLTRSSFTKTDALKRVFSDLEDFRRSSKQVLSNSLLELDVLTKSEYDFNANLIAQAGLQNSDIISVNAISQSKSNSYRSQELSVNQTELEAVNNWSRRRKQKILEQIRKSSREGLDLFGIIESISGESGIVKATQFGATLAAETLHCAAISAAGNAIVQENKHLDLDLVILSIFDRRTSSKCFEKNGKQVFKELKGFRPPFHMKCRTSVFPIIGNFDVDVETSTSWFSKQSEETKKSVLGKKRYEAYSEDKFSLKFPKDFINSNGDLWTLEELSSKGKL